MQRNNEVEVMGQVTIDFLIKLVKEGDVQTLGINLDMHRAKDNFNEVCKKLAEINTAGSNFTEVNDVIASWLEIHEIQMADKREIEDQTKAVLDRIQKEEMEAQRRIFLNKQQVET